MVPLWLEFSMRAACVLLAALVAASTAQQLTEDMLRLTMPADAAATLVPKKAVAGEYNASTALDFVYHRYCTGHTRALSTVGRCKAPARQRHAAH
jgi:hypothetical protein